MPIYAYRCATCGHAQDVLQKMSDERLTVCPACGAATFEKQLTAAGFQLKGSGWYVTDFRNGNTAAAAKKDGDAAAPAGEGAAKSGEDSKGGKDGAPAGPADGTASAPAVDKPGSGTATGAAGNAAPAVKPAAPVAAPASQSAKPAAPAPPATRG